jgi:hypothetical protein
MEAHAVRDFVADRRSLLTTAITIMVITIVVGAVAFTHGLPRVDASATVSDPASSSDQPSTVERARAGQQRGMRATVERPRHRTSVESTWLAEHRLTPGVIEFVEEGALFGVPLMGRSPRLVERAELTVGGPVLRFDDGLQ